MEPRKLIALPDGSVILLADVKGSSTKSQKALAARISTKGSVIWRRTVSDNSAAVIFHSGHYDPITEQVVIVGRRTIGGDSGRCDNWSQSLVFVLNAQDGGIAYSDYFGEKTKSAGNRQALFDIAPGQEAGSFVVAGFRSSGFSAAHFCDRHHIASAAAKLAYSCRSMRLGAAGRQRHRLHAVRILGCGRNDSTIRSCARSVSPPALPLPHHRW